MNKCRGQNKAQSVFAHHKRNISGMHVYYKKFIIICFPDYVTHVHKINILFKIEDKTLSPLYINNNYFILGI